MNRHSLLVIVLLVSALAALPPASAKVIHVDAGSPGTAHDGKSWPTAYRTIQQAVNASAPTDEIWTAEGTYVEHLAMKPSIAIYGGFAGTETSRSQRNPSLHPTILDGAGSGSVVTGGGASSIDGFTIRNGFYGVYCVSAGFTATNCIIADHNSGVQASGSGSFILTNCVVTGCANAGASCAPSTASSITNCTFVGNGNYGIYSADSSVTIANTIVAFGTGTGIHLEGGSPIRIRNCVYANGLNYGGLAQGPADIQLDPLFRDRSAGDYRITAGSPCIDSGEDSVAPSRDIEGCIRPQDGDGNISRACDTGAYEHPLDLLNAKRIYPEGSTVAMSGVVSASFNEGSVPYLERLDRSAGIGLYTNQAFTVGEIVNVVGEIRSLLTEERFVVVDAPPEPVGGTVSLRPMGLLQRNLVGGPLGLQMGIAGMPGINNVGLLIRTWGRVTHVDQGFFCVDDGSGITDYSGCAGARVFYDLCPAEAVEGSMVEVTGISCCTAAGETVHRCVWASGVRSIRDPEPAATASGLEYLDIKSGAGTPAERGDTVTVHYKLWLTDCFMVDGSNGTPFTFMLESGSVIPGFDEGVTGMSAGGTRLLIVPPELGYGDAGSPPRIPGGATLLFRVDLLSVEQP